MIISNVVIENFRCYYGKSSIQFNQDGKITLIWGDSGYGKSSFLQFFRWMFYGNPDFGTTNDKPLYNIPAYKEAKLGDTLSVYGQIDFEHLGVKYSLRKEVRYEVSISVTNAKKESMACSFMTLINDTWVPYSGDVNNKINTIFPKELSKYFLLDGEKARDIVLDSNELRKAIHALFGLNVYEQAIKHIGVQSNPRTVLGIYKKQMASKITSKQGGSPSAMQDAVEDLFYMIEKSKKTIEDLKSKIAKCESRRTELLKILGQASSKSNIQQLIKTNEDAIKQHETTIKETRRLIGNLFYRYYPYLILAKLSSVSSATLRDKNEEFSSTYKNVFENLKKELLKEILEKNKCVCGRELDAESEKHINGIMATMPPDSYVYQFGQFISKAKNEISASRLKIIEYNDLILKIADCEKKIEELTSSNNEKLEELKKLDTVGDFVSELEKIDSDLRNFRNQLTAEEKELGKNENLHTIALRRLDGLLKDSKVSSVYKRKLDFFEQLKDELINEKAQKEKEIREILNKCVRDIFKKLTTQTELNVNNIQFVNDDFSLRTTYLTGGQLAVDEYSYVIGIVKALQECKMENNENPIIIDAPFAFTGNAQSEHIFKTLPTVSKQTVLLTLDLNKIKNLLEESNLYDFYVIENETQEKATLKRGDINDIKL